jgi:hypothetical protein
VVVATQRSFPTKYLYGFQGTKLLFLVESLTAVDEAFVLYKPGKCAILHPRR